MTIQTCNEVLLEGLALTEPERSHENHGAVFYRFLLQVPRLSGAADTLPVLVSQALRDGVAAGETLRLSGQLRSFNNRSGVGSRLVLTVYAREAEPGDGTAQNHIRLSGSLCKPPVYRSTPFGREICDMMLAVNRAFGKSDYIPCIAWGRNAQYASRFQVGDRVRIGGRLQSREYQKLMENGEYMVRNAFEVSAFTLEADTPHPPMLDAEPQADPFAARMKPSENLA